MTVRELVARLSEADPEQEVFLDASTGMASVPLTCVDLKARHPTILLRRVVELQFTEGTTR